jgi:transposase
MSAAATGRAEERDGLARRESDFVEHQVLEPYGVGIDCHSKFVAVCVLVQRKGRVERLEKSFPVDWPSLTAARSWAVAAIGGSRAAEPLRYCIESTGCYHMPVLRSWGGKPSVVNPLLAGPTRRKTDVLDARLLAHHSITGMWPESFLASEAGLQLRVLWACRAEAMRAATRASNRINNIILRFGHVIAAKNAIRSSVGRALVDSLVAGDVPPCPQVSPLGLPAPVRPVIAELAADLDAATAREAAARRQAQDFVAKRAWPAGKGRLRGGELLRLLMTVPGVGITTALTWLSEVLDPGRFACADQVAAFCGCDPSVKVSAGKVTDHVRRKGSSRLHKALLFAASGLMRQPLSAHGAWGLSIAGRHKKGVYRKATSAIARRLATSLWHVHRLGEPYDESKYSFGAEQRFVPGLLAEVGLSRAQAACLPPHVTRADELARLYRRGLLGGLPGLGKGGLEKISRWAESHRARDNQPNERSQSGKDRKGRPLPARRAAGTAEEGSEKIGRRPEVLHQPVRPDPGQGGPGGPLDGQSNAPGRPVGGRPRRGRSLCWGILEPRGGDGSRKLGGG